MASRNTYPLAGSFDADVVKVFAAIKFGSSGAPTLQKWTPSTASPPGSYGTAPSTGPTPQQVGWHGVKSVSRNSAGDYTITLQDTYQRLLSIRHVFDTSGNSGSAPASPKMFVKAQAVNTITGPTVRVVFTKTTATADSSTPPVITTAETATDPASGEMVLLEITLSNSQAL